MINSPILGLPLVQAAQAQKHVTLNEALVLLDACAQIGLVSVSTTVPPALAIDGECYGIPSGATAAWAVNIGDIAIRSNGGWIFVTPQTGWNAWITDQNSGAIYDGGAWLAGAVNLTPHKAATIQEVVEIDVSIGVGATHTVVAAIPAQSMVIGITGRVLTQITGALSDWKLGVAASDARYGSALGLPSGSWVRGLTSAPQTYYSDTDLLMTAVGGDFAGGDVRLAIHSMRLAIPTL